MAIKTFVLTQSSWGGEYFIAGFRGIDEIRQSDHAPDVELYVQYDETQLNQISRVQLFTTGHLVADRPDNGRVLGKVRAQGDWAYLYYQASPASTGYVEKALVVTGSVWTLDVYVPGFVGVDEMRQVDEWGGVELHIRQDLQRLAEVDHIKLNGYTQDPPTIDRVELGVVRSPFWGNRNVYYTKERVAPPSPTT
ncbi:hypothetical protein NONI108955_36465 [Nocardia ninae]|uniref:Uncharacterized protein n=1 Tax=Nocardia ninae NBRC 108245 TaxID=1210091 RepID=A0A511MGF5_9NOCA|nr:hypothetical protein [Nocardia ninae]GEM39501.1 hypothetical protein NN4_40200 [Nocardia ninae NBRC 108245]